MLILYTGGLWLYLRLHSQRALLCVVQCVVSAVPDQCPFPFLHRYLFFVVLYSFLSLNKSRRITPSPGSDLRGGFALFLRLSSVLSRHRPHCGGHSSALYTERASPTSIDLGFPTGCGPTVTRGLKVGLKGHWSGRQPTGEGLPINSGERRSLRQEELKTWWSAPGNKTGVSRPVVCSLSGERDCDVRR